MMAKEEKPYKRRDKWTKEAYKELEEAEKKLREKKKQQKKELTALEQHDEEQLARKYHTERDWKEMLCLLTLTKSGLFQL